VCGTDLSESSVYRLQMQQREGYLEYEWANPGESKPRLKALYMAHFAPWDWIISASSYRDEFDELVQVDDFRTSVLEHAFGDTGYSFIMDDTGKFIIHPQLTGVNIAKETDSRGNPFPQGILRQKRGTVEYDWINPGEDDYRKKIAVFDTIPELGWIVASTGYLDEIQSPLRLLAYVVVGITSVMILMLLSLSWWVANVATRPLPLLVQALDEGSRGNLSKRLDEMTGAEFRQLAAYFNHFMDNLESSRSELIQSEEKYRDIFEQAVEGMFQMSPGGLLVNINPAMAAMFGYADPETMLAEVRSVGRQLYAASLDRDNLVNELLVKGKVVGLQAQLRRRDGSLFWGEISERAIFDPQGTPLLFEGIIKDVTAQHELMERLSRAKEEAEAAYRLKSDFLITISHEMRTPLTSMLGYSQMVRRHLTSKIAPALLPSQQDAAKSVERSADNLAILEIESRRLAELIEEMLDYAKFEAGGVCLCLKKASPLSLARQAVRDVSAMAGEKGLALKIAIPEDTPCVAADEERIRQVMRHLLHNAVKFTDQGGVTISTTTHASEVEFAVRDSGAAIPADSLERVFGHFTQLGDAMTDKPQGVGLGLALCRSIIAVHQGRIWAESEPGRGSVFRFTLPTAKAE